MNTITALGPYRIVTSTDGVERVITTGATIRRDGVERVITTGACIWRGGPTGPATEPWTVQAFTDESFVRLVHAGHSGPAIVDLTLVPIDDIDSNVTARNIADQIADDADTLSRLANEYANDHDLCSAYDDAIDAMNRRLVLFKLAGRARSHRIHFTADLTAADASDLERRIDRLLGEMGYDSCSDYEAEIDQ